jgi:WD40 repeat protein
MLATCDSNREVLVWDPAAGAVKMDKMVFHKARVTCLSWCPDGVRLATVRAVQLMHSLDP